MTYRVIDKRTGDDITNDYYWVIRPSGVLCYVDHGDLIGLTYAEPVFMIEEEKKNG